jgi:hypothetical protein
MLFMAGGFDAARAQGRLCIDVQADFNYCVAGAGLSMYWCANGVVAIGHPELLGYCTSTYVNAIEGCANTFNDEADDCSGDFIIESGPIN